MSIHDNLADAVIESQGRNVYRVRDKYAVAKSPAQAALAYVGADQVELVPMRAKYDAALGLMIERSKNSANPS